MNKMPKDEWTPEDVESDFITAMQGGKNLQQIIDEDDDYSFPAFLIGISIFLAVVILLICLISPAHSQEIRPADAVHCILGEARGEGYDSMLAHAEAIRNRGHLQGVYGCRVDLSKEMSYLKARGIYANAVNAWRQSQYSKTVFGADHWGSVKVDGKWIAKMKKAGYVQTAVVGNTAFYRRAGK